jgi:hypothetical protein
MNIESAKYVFYYGTTNNSSITCVIDGQTMSVPLDPANRHYQAIQEWVAEGNTIQEAD